MKTRLISASAAVLLAIAAAPASAAVIDFNSVTPLDGCGGVSVGGLTFTSGSSICTGVWQNNPMSSNGTPALIWGFGDMVITRTGGGAFGIDHFKAGISWYSTQQQASIDVVGIQADGTIVPGAFLTGPHLFSYGASGVDVVSLRFSGLSDGYMAMDDLVVHFPAVPEPATWALMITGFGLTGAAVRRRRVALAA